MESQKKGVRAIYVLPVFIVLLIGAVFWLQSAFQPRSKEMERRSKLRLDVVTNLPEEIVAPSHIQLMDKGDSNCRMYNCFNVYKCDGQLKDQISVYLYPLAKHVDMNGDSLTPAVSKEFYELYATIADSKYYTDDPKSACVFIPPIDILNQNNLKIREVSQILYNLPYWNQGSNHLLFNIIAGTPPDFNTVIDVSHDKAMVAGGGFSHWTYRPEFDISIPVYNPLTEEISLTDSGSNPFRSWLLISSQTNFHSEIR